MRNFYLRFKCLISWYTSSLFLYFLNPVKYLKFNKSLSTEGNSTEAVFRELLDVLLSYSGKKIMQHCSRQQTREQ